MVDPRSDGNRQLLWQLQELYQTPDFVKTAGERSLLGAASMAPTAYAAPEREQFPCHTGPATWLSSLYFHHQKAAGAGSDTPQALALIERRLDRAARYHQIEGEVLGIKEAVAEAYAADLESLPDQLFALVWRGEHQGQSFLERALPLRNPGEVKAAAAYLERYQGDLAYTDRLQVARKTLSAALHYDAPLGESGQEFLRKAAGYGTCSLESLRGVVLERAGALHLLEKDPLTAGSLDDLARLSLDPGVAGILNSPERLVKLAELLEGIDRDHRLQGLSGVTETLFGLCPQKAASFHQAHVPLANGQLYDRADLAGLSMEHLAAGMGDSFALQVGSPSGLFVDQEKLASLLPTLAKGDAELFDRLAKSAGILPRFQQSPDPVPERLPDLAALHRPAPARSTQPPRGALRVP